MAGKNKAVPRIQSKAKQGQEKQSKEKQRCEYETCSSLVSFEIAPPTRPRRIGRGPLPGYGEAGVQEGEGVAAAPGCFRPPAALT